MARVLVSETLSKAGLDLLRSRGHEVNVHLDLSAQELRSMITEADALIVRSATVVDEQLLEAAPQLQVVGRAGVGLDALAMQPRSVAPCLRHGPSRCGAV